MMVIRDGHQSDANSEIAHCSVEDGKSGHDALSSVIYTIGGEALVRIYLQGHAFTQASPYSHRNAVSRQSIFCLIHVLLQMKLLAISLLYSNYTAPTPSAGVKQTVPRSQANYSAATPPNSSVPASTMAPNVIIHPTEVHQHVEWLLVPATCHRRPPTAIATGH